MMRIELSMFEGMSLIHLHKNTKNSVKSPIKVCVWPTRLNLQAMQCLARGYLVQH